MARSKTARARFRRYPAWLARRLGPSLSGTTRSARKASLRIGWAACSCCSERTPLPQSVDSTRATTCTTRTWTSAPGSGWRVTTSASSRASPLCISRDARAVGTSDISSGTCAAWFAIFFAAGRARPRRTRHAECRPCSSASLISIVETYDVILAQVAPRLNLYQEKRLLSHVFEPMLGLDRDVRGFAFREDFDLLASRYPRGTRHHHPVLRPVVMHLQRERLARLHHDALDLEALA